MYDSALLHTNISFNSNVGEHFGPPLLEIKLLVLVSDVCGRPSINECKDTGFKRHGVWANILIKIAKFQGGRMDPGYCYPSSTLNRVGGLGSSN